MIYEIITTRVFEDYRTKEERLESTNKREALKLAKIIKKQIEAGDKVSANANMIQAFIKVNSVYDKQTRLKCGYTGDNYYHYEWNK